VDEHGIRLRLARQIEEIAQAVVDGKVVPTWGGHQLVALIRHWGYRGHDWQTPDGFDELELVMTDLECFPDGRMTQDEHIVAAARSVLADAKGVY
jgi:hypothetical protein